MLQRDGMTVVIPLVSCRYIVLQVLTIARASTRAAVSLCSWFEKRMCLQVHVSVYGCVEVCALVTVATRVCTRMYSSVCVCACVLAFVVARACARGCVHACARMRAHAHLEHVCVCMRAWTGLFS